VGPHPDRQRRPLRQSPEPIETQNAGAHIQRPDDEEKKRRARFAADIARSEFGHHYWDARREAATPKRAPPRG
jgi:hypothetical protein